MSFANGSRGFDAVCPRIASTRFRLLRGNGMEKSLGSRGSSFHCENSGSFVSTAVSIANFFLPITLIDTFSFFRVILFADFTLYLVTLAKMVYSKLFRLFSDGDFTGNVFVFSEKIRFLKQISTAIIALPFLPQIHRLSRAIERIRLDRFRRGRGCARVIVADHAIRKS